MCPKEGETPTIEPNGMFRRVFSSLTQGSSLSRVSFGKFGIQADARNGIVESIVGISLFEVGGRSVAEIHVVGSIGVDCFRVHFNGFRNIASLERSISFGFELSKEHITE